MKTHQSFQTLSVINKYHMLPLQTSLNTGWLGKGMVLVSVNNILFKHTDTYRIYMNNLHTQMYITVI